MFFKDSGLALELACAPKVVSAVETLQTYGASRGREIRVSDMANPLTRAEFCLARCFGDGKFGKKMWAKVFENSEALLPSLRRRVAPDL